MKQLHPDLPIAEWPFEDLAKQYAPLIGKFSSFDIPNHDRGDLRQELLLLLFRCQEMYDPTKGVRFYHYFERACRNRLGTLNWNEKRLHGKNRNYGHAPDGTEEGDHFLSIEDRSLIDPAILVAISQLSPKAKRFVRARLNGVALHRVLSRKDADEAKREVARALPRGGYN